MTTQTRSGLLCIALLVCGITNVLAQPARDTTLTAPDLSSVTIDRDAYGVPHISATTEPALFFAQGYAAAEDRLFQMETFRRITLGRLAEIYGPGSLADDRATLTLVYTDAERTAQFNALSAELQAILTAYRDGINAYLDNVIAEPSKFKPREFDLYSIPVTDWTVEDLLAVIQGFLRGFGGNGGDELTRLQELLALGQSTFDATYPINDPSAPVTILSSPSVTPKLWEYSGIQVAPEAATAVADVQSRALSGMPKFGSFAATVNTAKSASGNVLLLGGPQMGEPTQFEPSRTMEVELISPTIHVGGMTVAGAPGVIIGHNDFLAWTMTSGQSDNTDVFVESTNPAGTQYLFNAVFQDFESITDNIPVAGQADDVFTHFRTIHGPVVGTDIPNQQAYSVQTTFWGEEMSMMQGLYDIWKSTNVDDFQDGVEQIVMSFNVLYVGPASTPGSPTTKYWHAGRYQDRTDGVDPRLPHAGIGTEEWGGFIPFASLPQADGSDQDYFVNWNNKPQESWDQGDNVPWIVGNVFRDRVDALHTYVGGTTPFSFADLKSIPATINDHGTYTQAIEILGSAQQSAKASAVSFSDENLNPPGQSGFISLAQDTSANFRNQWSLHMSFGFKDMLFTDTSLPVEIGGLRAVATDGSVDLSWTAFSETANAGFEISHAPSIAVSADTKWDVVGFVDGRGTANEPHQYAFRIANLSDGRHEFRLRQINFDGSIGYSSIVTTVVGEVNPVLWTNPYPNPSDVGASFGISVEEAQRARIELYDTTGRRIRVLFDGLLSPGVRHPFRIDTADLPTGLYSISLTADVGRISRSIMVVR